MTPADDFGPLDEALRKQAADWLALLHGPDADAARPAFDAWLTADPAHLRAFDQVSARYDQSAFVSSRPVGRDRRLRRASFRERRPAASAAIAAGLVLLAGGSVATYVTMHPVVSPSAPAGTMLASAVESSDGALRRIALQDGSNIILDRYSAVAISYSAARRSVDLRQGRARFEAAHDPARPFVVNAGHAVVTARGTLFDVALTSHGGTVSLLRGLVEVRLTGMGPEGARLLRAGQRLEFVSSRPLPPPTTSSVPFGDDDWTTMLSFDGTGLADAVARINRGAARPIQLGTGLGALRVTGAFRAGDSTAFAAAVAATFGLAMDAGNDVISLSRPADPRKKVGG